MRMTCRRIEEVYARHPCELMVAVAAPFRDVETTLPTSAGGLISIIQVDVVSPVKMHFAGQMNHGRRCQIDVRGSNNQG